MNSVNFGMNHNLPTIFWFLLILVTEAMAFYCVKTAANDATKAYYLPIGVAFYIGTIISLYNVLKLGQGIAVVNILWSIASVLYGTLIGILIFGETITNLQLIGAALGFVAIVLICMDGNK